MRQVNLWHKKKPTFFYINRDNTRKFRDFFNELQIEGCAKILSNQAEQLESFEPNTLNDIEKIANEIKDIVDKNNKVG